MTIEECQPTKYIDGIGHIPLTKIREWDIILKIQLDNIRDEFIGCKACKNKQMEVQARVDALYGDGIFRVAWFEGTAFYVYLINPPKLVKRLLDIERSNHYWERKEAQLGYYEKKYGHYEVKKENDL